MRAALLAARDALAALNVPMRAAPSPDGNPDAPPDEYPVLAIRVPAGQAAALLAADGYDPTDVDGAGGAAAGTQLRRLLSRLRTQGAVTAWHALQEGAVTWVHVQVDQDQCADWLLVLDWTSPLVAAVRRAGHTFA